MTSWWGGESTWRLRGSSPGRARSSLPRLFTDPRRALTRAVAHPAVVLYDPLSATSGNRPLVEGDSPGGPPLFVVAASEGVRDG